MQVGGLSASLRSTALQIIMAVAVLAGAVWLGMDLHASRDTILAEKRDLVQQKSQFMSQWFGTTILSADYVLRDILGRVAPAGLGLGPDAGTPAWREQVTRLLMEKRQSLDGLDGISVYGPDCVFSAVTEPKVLGFRSNQSFCRDPSIQVSTETAIQYMPTERSASRRPVLLVSRNVVDADGRLQAGVLAAIDLSFAQNWLNSFPVGPRDVLAIVDGEDTLLARNPLIPDAVGRRAPAPPGQPSFGETRGSATFIAVSPFDGRERIFGISKIERIPLLVLVGLDREDVLADWRHRAVLMGGGYLVLTVLVFGLMRAHRIALQQRETLHRLAVTDVLTGIANRRYLLDAAEVAVQQAWRTGTPLSVLQLDIDHFKQVNDRWGHAAGDRAICLLTQQMAAHVRSGDIIGRLGGEEFAVLLPGLGSSEAAAVAERLRQAVADARFDSGSGGEQAITVSIGVADLREADTGFEEVQIRADAALYRAKAAGRNRVMMA